MRNIILIHEFNRIRKNILIMASLQAFTKSDLLEFTKSNSDKFIILIHGNVYDITKFLNEVR